MVLIYFGLKIMKNNESLNNMVMFVCDGLRLSYIFNFFFSLVYKIFVVNVWCYIILIKVDIGLI